MKLSHKILQKIISKIKFVIFHKNSENYKSNIENFQKKVYIKYM